MPKKERINYNELTRITHELMDITNEVGCLDEHQRADTSRQSRIEYVIDDLRFVQKELGRLLANSKS
jgi:hypothetical protein